MAIHSSDSVTEQNYKNKNVTGHVTLVQPTGHPYVRMPEPNILPQVGVCRQVYTRQQLHRNVVSGANYADARECTSLLELVLTYPTLNYT